MSYLTSISDEHAWTYFERHLLQIPSEKNRNLVREFLMEKEEYLARSTLGTYLSHIKSFGIFLGAKQWLDANRTDVLTHIKFAVDSRGRGPQVEPRRRLGKYTKYQRMIMLREFYKWLPDSTWEETFRDLPFRKPSLDEQMEHRHDLVSAQELQSMLDSCRSIQLAALISFLADTGYRCSEIALLNIGDIRLDQFGMTAQHSHRAPGLKTGPRKVPVRLTFSVGPLRQWLRKHPLKGLDDPLFVSESNRNRNSRLSGVAIWNRINSACKAAQIRHLHPHQFRHTAASVRSGRGWNEEMLRLQFGWSKGSAMPSYYSHLEGFYDEYARSH